MGTIEGYKYNYSKNRTTMNIMQRTMKMCESNRNPKPTFLGMTKQITRMGIHDNKWSMHGGHER